MSEPYSQQHLLQVLFGGIVVVILLLTGLGAVAIQANSAANDAKRASSDNAVLRLVLHEQCEATRKFYVKERQQWEGMVAVVQASNRALPPDVVAGIKKSLDETFVLPNCGKGDR